MRRAGVLIAALAVAVIGCMPVVSLGPADKIMLTNATTSAVAVHVNGGWAGTYPPGAVTEVPIIGHGGPPYAIEIRSPSGAVLTSVTFSAEEARSVADGSSASSNGSSVGCGWIEIAYGDVSEPPPNDAAKPPPAGVCP